MGGLENQATGRRLTLGARCLVGRAVHCTLQVNNPRVSGEHATLRYRQGWVLRDLGSCNGTMVDEVPVEPGSEVALKLGSRVSFGSRDECWRLVDDAAPQVVARCLDHDAVVMLEDGVLALPDSSAPECQIFRHGRDGWLVEVAGETKPVKDQQCLEVAGQRWCIEVPQNSPSVETTHRETEPQRAFTTATLKFEVSLDRAHVELHVEGSNWDVDLGYRTFNEMLLVLAEARQEDAREHADLSAAEHGWLHLDEVCRRADLRDEKRIDQYVFHARKQLTGAGVEEAAQIVERTRKGQLRIGTDRLKVVSL